MLDRIFGSIITLSTSRVIPTRRVGEQHVREDKAPSTSVDSFMLTFTGIVLTCIAARSGSRRATKCFLIILCLPRTP